MEAARFSSVDAIVDYAFKRIERFTVVSFDVFDTLLIRRVHDPDLVKNSVSRFIHHLALKRSIQISALSISRLRDEIELRHRRRAGIVYPDYEANYYRFIRELVAEIFQTGVESQENQELVESILNYELEVEGHALIARLGWIPLLEGLKERAVTTVALSDMYLPGSAIRSLLDKAGLGNYFNDVHSSADSCRAKASGDGFRRLQELYGWSPNQWLHIGDNPFSDQLQPESFGITAVCLSDSQELKRKSILKRYHDVSRYKAFWYGRYLEQIALPLEREVGAFQRDNILYTLGYSYFGPLLCGFVASLLHRARKMQVPALYFLSREGRLLHQIWEQMAPIISEGGSIPETHYLSVSRRALAEASCGLHGLSQHLVDISFLPAGNRDFRDLCKVANIDPQPLAVYLRRHGIDLDTPLSPNYLGYSNEIRQRLAALIEDHQFQASVKEQKRDAYLGFKLYVDSSGLLNYPDVALVDIGWLGTIQRFLDLNLAESVNRPTLHGWLFAATRGVPFPTTARSQVSGWIYDGERGDVFASMILNYLELFEEVCRPAEPGLIGYTASNSNPLIFRKESDPEHQSELKQSDYIKPLQQGLLDSAIPMARALVLGDNHPDRMKSWLVHRIVMLMSFPRTSEIQALRNRYHFNDLENPKQIADNRRYRPKRLWEESDSRLRYLPGLRTYYALRHIAWQLMKLS